MVIDSLGKIQHYQLGSVFLLLLLDSQICLSGKISVLR